MQNQQQPGIIQIYYGVTVKSLYVTMMMKNNPESIQLYLADGRYNPRATEFSKTVQLTK